METANMIALKANKNAYLGLVILSIIHGVNVYISLSFTEYVVNAAFYLINNKTSFNQVAITVFIYTAVILIFLGINIIITNLRNRLRLDVNHMLKEQLNTKLSHIKWEYYESHETISKIYEVRRHLTQAILELVDTNIT